MPHVEVPPFLEAGGLWFGELTYHSGSTRLSARTPKLRCYTRGGLYMLHYSHMA